MIATLDTKGREAAYVRDCGQELGVRPLLMDVGTLGDPLVAPDIRTADLAEAASKQVYARTSLVLITNTAFPATIGSIRDLETMPVRYIAIGDPTTSTVGRDAVQFLKYRKLEPRLKSHYLLGEHSKAVRDLVSKGEAELGLVYRTDAVPVKRVRIIVPHLPTAIGLSLMG